MAAPASGGGAAPGDWAVKMLGDTLLVHSDPTKPLGVPKPTAEALAGKQFVVLFFSASWCPPCKKFSSFLGIVYEDMIESAEKNEVEVVLVSQCKTLADFNGYFAGMQWAAVPYTFEGREGIFTQNDVHGLPQALVLRVSDGSVVLKDCRELVNTKKTLVGIFQ